MPKHGDWSDPFLSGQNLKASNIFALAWLYLKFLYSNSKISQYENCSLSPGTHFFPISGISNFERKMLKIMVEAHLNSFTEICDQPTSTGVPGQTFAQTPCRPL
jgi:hypothetical protein